MGLPPTRGPQRLPPKGPCPLRLPPGVTEGAPIPHQTTHTSGDYSERLGLLLLELCRISKNTKLKTNIFIRMKNADKMQLCLKEQTEAPGTPAKVAALVASLPAYPWTCCKFKVKLPLPAQEQQ